MSSGNSFKDRNSLHPVFQKPQFKSNPIHSVLDSNALPPPRLSHNARFQIAHDWSPSNLPPTRWTETNDLQRQKARLDEQQRRMTNMHRDERNERLLGTKTSLENALLAIVEHLGNTSLAMAWADSVWDPIDLARDYVEDTTRGEDVTVSQEVKVIERLESIKARLGRAGAISAEGALFVRGIVLPFEQIVDSIEIPNDALPATSWFRGVAAKYLAITFKNVQSQNSNSHFDTLMSRFELFSSNYTQGYEWRSPPVWSTVFSSFNDACNDWRQIHRDSARNPRKAATVASFLDHIADVLESVVAQRVVQPQFWHFWIPTGEFLSHLPSEISSLDGPSHGHGHEAHTRPERSLTHSRPPYSHRQCMNYGL